MKQNMFDRVVLTINNILLGLFSITILYPFYYIIILSFNDGQDAKLGGIYFWPRVFTLDNYAAFFKDPLILTSAVNSVVRTVLGVIISLAVTSLFAYAVSKKKLMFRKVYIGIAFFTMYFSGGLIPTFLNIRNLGLLNNFLVYIIPASFSVYNMLLFRSYFQGISPEIEESAYIDGANDLQIFIKLAVPIAKPVFAALTLYVAVAQWNDWMDTMLYAQKEQFYTLSYLLIKRMNIVSAEQQQAMDMTQVGSDALQRGSTSESLLLATTVITAFPIIAVYPFLQKYFVKGIMLGSVKG